ncbi:MULTISPECIES: EAL domain-containing protein [unclassified Shinella]|uniref:EAL domain-containing protein n=1 Tax=unclassified Shinella TaxID=2643062 RepID=UPI00234F45DA|nr:MULTISPECIES: EAL domain-containing protein [unclassified Shinella]MCO5139430.1 EAL domain-containing protein [Shinella sp.]MDC7255842.1 EAL domain-containing protein [Shinella sp. YE25]
MHSVESRFIAIVIGALLIFVAPLFVLFLILSSDRVARERLQNTEVLLQANVQALGKPLWDFDKDSIDQIVGALQADADIVFVHVRDTSDLIDIRKPATRPDPDDTRSIVKADILYKANDGIKKVGTAEIWIRKAHLLSRFSKDEMSIFTIFFFAVATLFTAAIIGNRITIIRPLMRLTAAIEATRRLGSRHHVDWTSNDEMGALAHNFNEMQSKLEREEKELKLAHARATDIYNLTPAMLFSIDADNRITAVSDYWLTATGYRRAAVIGQEFTDFVAEDWRDTYRKRHDENSVEGGICEATVRFRCADGSMIDVLILETGVAASSSRQALSLSVMTDVTDLKEAENRNHRQAITDHLTGLLNRQGFESVLDELIGDVDKLGQQLACLFVDLDRFKWINDNLGHAAGDDVLCQVATRLRRQLRAGDRIARLGGDEFAILLCAPNACQLAMDVSERLVASLRTPLTVNGADLHVSASIGVAVYPDHAETAACLLQKSDMAMYARKRSGKNGVQLFDSNMVDIARKRLETEQFIDQGLREDWFIAHLQPIVSLADGRVAGFEALMRLNHPERGLLPPAEIIGIAEENGSIGRIGDCILSKSIASLAIISKLDGLADAYLAVNFSPLQFEPALPARLAALLLEHGITPSRIVVEITEAVLMLDNPVVREVLDALSDLGCRIALDDFGTGYSSLSYLNRFPVDIVKVDQSFTRSLSSDQPDVRRKSRMLVEGIRTISHQMGCAVVAEGIETTEQWDILQAMQVEFGQGYLLSRPLPLDALLEKLDEFTVTERPERRAAAS